MLYSFKRGQVLPPLPSAGPLMILESDSAELLAELEDIPVEEIVIRFRNANKAYVAYWEDKPAALGWVATDWSLKNELSHEFLLPKKHFYFWNFTTFARYRGKGIYPRLLQHILNSEMNNAECFWIIREPGSEASEKGISRAGFHLESTVTMTAENELMVNSEAPSAELIHLLRVGKLVRPEKEQVG